MHSNPPDLAPTGKADVRPRRLAVSFRLSLVIKFNGASEYLDDLVARIDVPRLNDFSIIFFEQLDLDTPHLAQFIRRTPYSKAFGKAHINFLYW